MVKICWIDLTNNQGAIRVEIRSETKVPDLSKNVEQGASSLWSSTCASFSRQEEAFNIPQQGKEKQEKQDEAQVPGARCQEFIIKQF